MSLKDTIRGAREEAAQSGNPFERTKADEASDQETVTPTGKRYARSSAASRKPARAAAAGVRVVSSDGKTTKGGKPRSEMTKEEKKAERKERRAKEDRRYDATQIILEDDNEYLHARKVWQRLLLVGVVFMASALVMYVSTSNLGKNAPEWMAIGSLVLMVISYVILIVGLIYDYRHIKPLRQKADQRVASMSEKKITATLDRKGK